MPGLVCVCVCVCGVIGTPIQPKVSLILFNYVLLPGSSLVSSSPTVKERERERAECFCF